MYEGTAIASRMPMMMITTRSSIRVKPPGRSLRLIRSLSRASMCVLLLIGAARKELVAPGTYRRIERAPHAAFGGDRRLLRARVKRFPAPADRPLYDAAATDAWTRACDRARLARRGGRDLHGLSDVAHRRRGHGDQASPPPTGAKAGDEEGDGEGAGQPQGERQADDACDAEDEARRRARSAAPSQACRGAEGRSRRRERPSARAREHPRAPPGHGRRPVRPGRGGRSDGACRGTCGGSRRRCRLSRTRHPSRAAGAAACPAAGRAGDAVGAGLRAAPQAVCTAQRLLGPRDRRPGGGERAAMSSGRPSRIRTARKDGRQVVTLRRADVDGHVVVECEVYPVDSLRVEPIRPGPYRFDTEEAANAFVEETGRTLEYLGCAVS